MCRCKIELRIESGTRTSDVDGALLGGRHGRRAVRAEATRHRLRLVAGSTARANHGASSVLVVRHLCKGRETSCQHRHYACASVMFGGIANQYRARRSPGLRAPARVPVRRSLRADSAPTRPRPSTLQHESPCNCVKHNS